MHKKITLSRAIVWIFSLTLCVNGLFFLCIKGFRYWKKTFAVDDTVYIKAIVQTGPQKEALKTSYLAELLDLSSDKPQKARDFDLKKAKERLLRSPVIKEARVKWKEPGILYIDYTTYQPLCLLYDYENVALDQDGIPFPILPFFSPKKLPEIYLGIKEEVIWKKPLCGEKVDFAFSLLKILEGPVLSDLFNVKRIDVSHAFEKSLGRREVVLLTEDELLITQKEKEIRYIFPRILRLSTKNYSQELSNYLKLREQLIEKAQLQLDFSTGEKVVIMPPKIIDFRIPQLAFVDDIGG